MGDITHTVTHLRLFNPEIKGLTANPEEFFECRRDRAHRYSKRIVADVAVFPDNDVERNNITFAEDSFEGRDPVNDFFVHRDAGVRRITAGTVLVAITSTPGSEASNPITAGFFQVLRRDARPHQWLELFKYGSGNGARLPHSRNPFFILKRDRAHAARTLASVRRPSVR